MGGGCFFCMVQGDILDSQLSCILTSWQWVSLIYLFGRVISLDLVNSVDARRLGYYRLASPMCALVLCL